VLVFHELFCCLVDHLRRLRGFRPRAIPRPGVQTRLPCTRIPGTRIPSAQSLRSGTRVRAGPVQLRVQRERPVHVRREEPTRIRRRQRLRQGIVQPRGARRFHPRGRVHRRRLQRFQRRSQEDRRRIQGPVQRRPGLQARLPSTRLPSTGLQASPVQASLLIRLYDVINIAYLIFCRFTFFPRVVHCSA